MYTYSQRTVLSIVLSIPQKRGGLEGRIAPILEMGKLNPEERDNLSRAETEPRLLTQGVQLLPPPSPALHGVGELPLGSITLTRAPASVGAADNLSASVPTSQLMPVAPPRPAQGPLLPLAKA